MQKLRRILLNAGRTIFLIGISISVAVTSGVSQAGNTPASKAAADGDATVRSDLVFDVVSIHLNKSVSDEWTIQIIEGGDEFRAMGVSLAQIIEEAFQLHSEKQLVNAPDWVWHEKFDFVAKVGFNDLLRWQEVAKRGVLVDNPMLQTMLQNALMDRCKLIVHRIPAETPGYALVVSKRIPNRKNLVEAKPDDAIPSDALKIALGGMMVPILSREDPVLHFFQTSMASLAAQLSVTGAPVEDRTGLTGKYNFALARLGNEGNPSVDLDLGPLGLRLVPVKILTKSVVIDQIERPSPN